MADATLGRAIISIDKRANRLRQRFSLAHEIGHWEQHRGQLLVCSKEDIGGSGGRRNGVSRERAATQFAAELLMTEVMLKLILRDYRKFNMHAVRQLARTFNTSKTAMAYRLVEMVKGPCILAAYRKSGCVWHISSKSIGHQWWPQRVLDPQSNAYSILFNGFRDDATMSDLDADTWFDVPRADRIEIGEQSFRVHDDLIIAPLVASSERMLAD
ncbi:ImmA/IrrE family metallo-endopeptidase [Phaeobacter inhibens]|nr:ImmA/IrrE family metallo-endopeptidase [Phaeobacter inhibens]